MEGVERDARGGGEVRYHLVFGCLETVVPHGVEGALGDLDRLLAQRRRQMDRELVAPEAVELPVKASHEIAQHAADPDDQVIAGAVAEVVVDVLEVVDVEE